MILSPDAGHQQIHNKIVRPAIRNAPYSCFMESHLLVVIWAFRLEEPWEDRWVVCGLVSCRDNISGKLKHLPTTRQLDTFSGSF